MEKQQLYQTIEAYLEGKLGSEEQTAFERELATDTDLAQEVDLHRRLQDQLSDTKKMDLRATLDEIAEEFPALRVASKSDTDTDNTRQSGGGGGGGIRKMWYAVAVAAALGGSLLWYQSSLGPNITDGPAISQDVEDPPEDPGLVENPTPNQHIPITPDEQEEDPIKEVMERPNTPAVAVQETPPEVFNPNSELEPLLGESTLSGKHVFAEGEIKQSKQNGEILLSFDATMETSLPMDEVVYLTLYSNDYPKGQVLRKKLVYDEVEGEYKLGYGRKPIKYYEMKLSEKTELDPALYYGVVTIGDSSEPLWVGKVQVEK